MNPKFKSWSMLLAMAAALSLSACREESLDGGKTSEEGNVLYISAAIALPSTAGTRSGTDTPDDDDDNNNNNNTNSDAKPTDGPDYEYGYDYENDVRSMILVIANEKDEYVTHTVVKGISQTPSSPNKFDFIVNGEIKHSDMALAYESGPLSENKAVKIYAFCNYTTRLLNLFEDPQKYDETYDNWINWAGTIEEDPSPAGVTPTISNTIWSPNSFLMTNAKSFTTSFPDDIDDWEEFADKDHPYQLDEKKNDGTALSPIYVERAAARFDFRDGSKNLEGAGPNNNTYPLLVKISGGINEDGEVAYETKNYFNIKLTRMALVNMSKQFYYLRRVSSKGMDDGAIIGGPETPASGATPYVVDTDAAQKSEEKGIVPGNGTIGKAGYHFNFRLYSDVADQTTGKYAYAMNNWYVDNISEVLGSDKTNDTWTNDTYGGQYKIWRYVTENTIPGIDQQKTIQSVGIIFKGSILMGEDLQNMTETDFENNKLISKSVKDALENVNEKSPVLYSFNNILYVGIEELVQAAHANGPGSPLWQAVTATLNEFDGLTIEEYLENSSSSVDEETFNIKVPVHGVTVYVASNEGDDDGWGYYCYYFYWNRHNDNLKSGRMGEMEFATVRNNVYKLAVTGISQFGHPRDPNHDPDPVEPEDPDEDPTDYIQVQVEVLPWVVRVNNIEF